MYKKGQYKQIALTPETYQELQKLGGMGDTFEDVVVRLLRERKK